MNSFKVWSARINCSANDENERRFLEGEKGPERPEKTFEYLNPHPAPRARQGPVLKLLVLFLLQSDKVEPSSHTSVQG